MSIPSCKYCQIPEGMGNAKEEANGGDRMVYGWHMIYLNIVLHLLG